MTKRPFFSLGKPKLKYPAIEDQGGEIKDVPLPGKVTLLVKDCDIGAITLKVGAQVTTGEKLKLTNEPDGYVISTVTGTVTGMSEYFGYLNQSYASIAIDVSGEDELNADTQAALKEPSFEVARDYLVSIPGKPDFLSLLKPDPPVNTVVVTCMDQDLPVSTNQQILKAESGKLAEGIEILKKVSRIGRVIIVATAEQSSLVADAGADVKEISMVYPAANPGIIAKDVLGSDYMREKSLEEMGIGFISAEAVISLADMFSKGEMAIDKIITVIGKDEVPVMVKARIGTPVKDVLDAVGIQTSNGDMVIFGGLMAGKAIYTEDMPVLADTDAILVQDNKQIVMSDDGQCVNCGECVRACPVNVPVNMLVRFLSSGLYEDAAEMYDLHSCIECGLCNYVCVARIPVFHHIMLGKYEFAKIKNAEGTNG